MNRDESLSKSLPKDLQIMNLYILLAWISDYSVKKPCRT